MSEVGVPEIGDKVISMNTERAQEHTHHAVYLLHNQSQVGLVSGLRTWMLTISRTRTKILDWKT